MLTYVNNSDFIFKKKLLKRERERERVSCILGDTPPQFWMIPRSLGDFPLYG